MTGPGGSARQIMRQNQGRLVLVVLLFVCLYFLVIFGEQAWRANRLEAEIAQQRTSIADIRRENAELAERAELMNSPAYLSYVERIARRDLGLARPGETVAIVPHQSRSRQVEPQPTIEPANPQQNWQRWIDAIFNQQEPQP